ncbi:ATP-dependent 6-phosphofructokinase [Trifolium repens]|nr:ATP-dependent 6-phosphofructokinase [Trifolium repens]
MREHFGAFLLVGDLVQKNALNPLCDNQLELQIVWLFLAWSLSIKGSTTNTRGRTLLRICQEKQQCEHERLHNSIQDLGINKVYIIGGDGTQKAASVIFEKITIKHYYLWKFYLSLQVLDAPSLQDDFYLNLVDWSSQNT